MTYFMFICNKCNKSVGPRISPINVVVEKKMINHKHRSNANPCRVDGVRDATDDPGGMGYQIVREAKYCSRCASVD